MAFAGRASINEFLARLSVESYPERVTAIAYYQLHNQQSQGVTLEDFRRAFSVARIPGPKNLSDVIAKCIRRGLLMDAESRDGQRAWQITQTGERSIEERLGRTQA